MSVLIEPTTRWILRILVTYLLRDNMPIPRHSRNILLYTARSRAGKVEVPPASCMHNMFLISVVGPLDFELRLPNRGLKREIT